MKQYIKTLYGLTVDKMEAVYREVQKAYYIEDIVNYIVENKIIEDSEMFKVDLNYIAERYITRQETGIAQICVFEDTIGEYFRNNIESFSTLNLDRL